MHLFHSVLWIASNGSGYSCCIRLGTSYCDPGIVNVISETIMNANSTNFQFTD
jgi:hypothetical protein